MKSRLSKNIMESMQPEMEEAIDMVDEAEDSNLVKAAADKTLLRHLTRKKLELEPKEDEDEKAKETHFAVKGRKQPPMQHSTQSKINTSGGNKAYIDSLARKIPQAVKKHAGDDAQLLLNSKVKENYIKHLRMILENEVEQAGVLMAAKGFSQDIQTMIEKMGRLMNEELGPVVDNMRMAYGAQQAEAFAQAMRQDMQSIMDNMLTVKDNIDDAVDELAAGQIPNMDNDMDAGADADINAGDNVDLDLPDELGSDFGDVQPDDAFGGDEAASGPMEDPLGRPQKESVQNLHKQLVEMKKRINKLKKLKESKKAK